MPDLSIIIPFFNESENLPEVPAAIARALDDAAIDYELIAVDNGSADDTGDKLRTMQEGNPRLRTIRVEPNQGYGWGVLNGMRAASGEYVGFMAGDGQTRPQDVVDTWRLMQRDRPDLAKVRRVVREDGLQRRLISFFANSLFPLLFPVRSRDINGTPKILKAELARELNLRSKDWFIDAEIMIKLGRRGARVAEIPVTFLPRAGGRSNVRLSTIIEFLRNIWRAL